MQDASNEPTKLVIFEGSEMGCQLLAHELEKSIYGVKVVGSRSSSLGIDTDMVRDADVALIGFGLYVGPVSAFDVLRDLRSLKDTLRCVMLLDRADDPGLVLEAFLNGASGIIGRSDSCERLCKCIQRVHEGQVWANNQQVEYMIQALQAQVRNSKSTRVRSLLNPKEKHIAELIMQGRTNHDIAAEMLLSEYTINKYVYRIHKKIGVSSRLKLIAYLRAQAQNSVASDSPKPIASR